MPSLIIFNKEIWMFVEPCQETNTRVMPSTCGNCIPQEINGKQKSKWMLTFSLIRYKIPIIHVWNPKACFFFHYFITKIPIIIHVWNLKSRVTFSWAHYKDSESQLYVVFFLLRHCITLHRIITNHTFHWEYWR